MAVKVGYRAVRLNGSLICYWRLNLHKLANSMLRSSGGNVCEHWLKGVPKMSELLPSDAPSVFISYTWADEQSALAIAAWLRDHGVKVIIDRWDFIAGDDLYESMVNAVKSVQKVIVLYSQHSKDRPYTVLERRIAQQYEAETASTSVRKKLLIFLCLDDAPLPLESSHRLAIVVRDKGFIEICEKLLDAILERKSRPDSFDWTQYTKKPPWKH